MLVHQMTVLSVNCKGIELSIMLFVLYLLLSLILSPTPFQLQAINYVGKIFFTWHLEFLPSFRFYLFIYYYYLQDRNSILAKFKYICVKLPFKDLNPNSYSSHSTNSYTCGMTFVPRVCDG